MTTASPDRADTRTASPSAEERPGWAPALPREWLDAVESPLYFTAYREYEMAAERCLGYDADDHPCYRAHRVLLTRLQSDDDEEFYEAPAYYEEMAAWRLRDERWLVFRRQLADDGQPGRGFYTLHPAMPR